MLSGFIFSLYVRQKVQHCKADLGLWLAYVNCLFFSDDLKDLSKRLSEANTAKCEALAKVDEIHSNEVNKEVKQKLIAKKLKSIVFNRFPLYSWQLYF